MTKYNLDGYWNVWFLGPKLLQLFAICQKKKLLTLRKKTKNFD